MIPFREPQKIPEANIQAELYIALKAVGVRCILEYTHEDCRFDCAVLSPDMAFVAMIIEVKSLTSPRTKLGNTRQALKYRRFGVPLAFVHRMEEIPDAVELAKKVLDGGLVNVTRAERERATARIFADLRRSKS